MQTNHSVTWIALLLISMLSFTKINAQAPDWQWAKSGGSKGLDFIYASASDKSGNIYITGYFESDILKLGSYKLTHTLNSTRQVFIAKYDSTGNVLWAQTAGGTSNDEPSALTCDIDGNIYLPFP